MTMMPIKKVCPKCKRTYSWNPDVGKIICPYCHGVGKVLEILKKKKQQ